MKDWLAMIGYMVLLVVLSVGAVILGVLFFAMVMALLALPVILIIWAIGAFL